MRVVMAKLCTAIALIVTALLSPHESFAKDFGVTITPPTTLADGTPVPATGTQALISHRIEYGTCDTSGKLATKLGESVVNMPTLTKAYTGWNPAQYCFRAYAKNGYGESDVSATKVFTVAGSPPGAPGITVQDVLAYEIAENDSVRVVGVVPMGSLCTAETKIAGGVEYRRVDARALDLTATPSTLPPIAWARCGA